MQDIATVPELGTAAVHAVVVHYRCLEHTRKCLASLAAARVPVTVVDNHSDDGSLPALEELCQNEGRTLVASPDNRGFGAGANAGIETALKRHPELAHVLLINPDAELLPGGLKALLATAHAHPDAGIVGGRVLGADGSTWFENGRVNPFTLSRLHRRAPAGREAFTASFVTGALMLIAADLLRDGLRFDEDYFLYVEDLDLCRQVQTRGRSLWVTAVPVAVHEGGASGTGASVLGGLTAAQVYWMTRSKVRFARRHLSCGQRAVFLLVATLIKPVCAVLTGRVRGLGAYFRGLMDGIFRRGACRRYAP